MLLGEFGYSTQCNMGIKTPNIPFVTKSFNNCIHLVVQLNKRWAAINSNPNNSWVIGVAKCTHTPKGKFKGYRVLHAALHSMFYVVHQISGRVPQKKERNVKGFIINPAYSVVFKQRFYLIPPLKKVFAYRDFYCYKSADNVH